MNAPSSPQASYAQLEVLIVMWDARTAVMLADALRHNGDAVTTVRNVQDACQRLQGGRVGLVVLDITAPQMDELALLRAARSSVPTLEIPFLFLIRADQPPPPLPRLGDEVVGDSWLALPCSPPKFVALAHRMLEQTMRQRDESRLKDALHARGPTGQAAALPLPKLGFSGQLGALGVTAILSLLENLRLTGVLTVSDGKHDGKVHFVKGAVTHAQLMDLEGAQALYLLFHLKDGAFSFEVAAPTPVRTIQSSTTTLLLEGMRQMDSTKAVIEGYRSRRGQATAPVASSQTDGA